MSQHTPHIHKGMNVRFDELTEPMTIVCRKATWVALEQLETGLDEVVAQRYQVKSKPKFAEGNHELESHYATKHEADARAKTLKDAGYSTEVVEPTEALKPPVSKGRYFVEYQENSTVPFAEESSWETYAEAERRADELTAKGFSSAVVDRASGQVVQDSRPFAGHTNDNWSDTPLTNDQRAQQAQATQQAEYLRETSAPATEFPGAVSHYEPDSGPLPPSFPVDPVITNPAPETPTEEWLRKEKAAKEHPDPVR